MKEWKSDDLSSVTASKGVNRLSKLRWWFVFLIILGVIGAFAALDKQVDRTSEEYKKGTSSVIEMIIHNVYAQAPADTQNEAFNPKPYIVLGVFVLLALVTLASVYAMLFSSNQDTVAKAGDVAKTLLGFFIGVGTSYLGL